MRTLAGDLLYSIRMLQSSPGFAATAILSLALGIGLNTAIFSLTSALLLHPLPYADAERLVILWNRSPGLNITEDWFSTAQYFDVRDGHHGFEQIGIAIGANYNWTGLGEPERIGAIRVSSSLLPMLGVRPAAGRLFGHEDDEPGAAAAILSSGTWMRRFGGDIGVIGRSITLNGRSYQIVGTLPPSFSLPREVLPTLGGAEEAEILVSLPLGPDAISTRTHEDYNIVGKLKRGVALEKAQSELDTITARLRRDYPDFYPPNGGLTFSIVPLFEQVVGGIRRSLWIVAGSVCFVLLIACANVANLLLARSLGRRKEIALRAALGASHGRIVRQLMTESVLLAVIGGGLGMILAAGSLRWIRSMGQLGVPRLQEVGLNAEVGLFTFCLSLICGVAFGLAPISRVGGLNLSETLKEAGRGASEGQALWGKGSAARKLLVVSELALCVVLLSCSGLLMRSLALVRNVPPGFNPEGVLTLGLTMIGPNYGNPQRVSLSYRQLWTGLEQIAGVSAAGGVSALPLSQMFAWGPITIEGRVPPAGENFVNADERIVGGQYFEAMRIPLRRGRLFSEHDTAETQPVAIIDDFMAQQFWPNQDPVGKRIRTGGVNDKTPWMTIIGVVGRVKQYALESDSRIAIYLHHPQHPVRELNVVLRSDANPATLVPAVKGAIRQLDAGLPVYQLKSMLQRIDESVARRRFATSMLSLFAALALVLAGVGVYGLMSYLVSQGNREIGIRIALGATQRRVAGMILRQGLAVVLPGAVCGLLGALALTPVLRSLLFGVSFIDPVTLFGIPLILLVTAGIAIYLPARRAAAVDPMVSLRNE